MPIPDGVMAEQLKDIVVRQLQQHPEERHLSAASIAIHAIGDAFCRVVDSSHLGGEQGFNLIARLNTADY